MGSMVSVFATEMMMTTAMMMAAITIVIIRPSRCRLPHLGTLHSANLMQPSIVAAKPATPPLPHHTPVPIGPQELGLISFPICLALWQSPSPLPAIFAQLYQR